jgi:hypothetical protein
VRRLLLEQIRWLSQAEAKPAPQATEKTSTEFCSAVPHAINIEQKAVLLAGHEADGDERATSKGPRLTMIRM